MAKRPIKLQASEDMDELSNEAPVVSVAPTAFASSSPPPAVVKQSDEPPVVSGTPVVRPPVTPKSDAPKNSESERKELITKAKEFGSTEGTGKRAFVRFARLLVDGGAAGTLSPSPKSQDAKTLYDAFSEASVKAAGAVTDKEKQSASSQLSKVRAFIRLGHKYPDEAGGVFDDTLTVHKELMSKPETSETVKFPSTYASLYAIAVAQCKAEQVGQRLTIDQIRDNLTEEKEVAREKTGADVLIDALNALEKAQRGKAPTDNSNGRAPVTHPALPDIIEALRATINDVDAEALKARDDEIEAMKEKKAKAKAEAEKKKAEAEAKKAATAAEKAAQTQAAGVTPESDEEVEDEEVEDEEVTFDEDELTGFTLPNFNPFA